MWTFSVRSRNLHSDGRYEYTANRHCFETYKLLSDGSEVILVETVPDRLQLRAV